MIDRNVIREIKKWLAMETWPSIDVETMLDAKDYLVWLLENAERRTLDAENEFWWNNTPNPVQTFINYIRENGFDPHDWYY